MDCMDQLIRRMRGENRFTPREKINEGEADEMVILLFKCKLVSEHFWCDRDNIMSLLKEQSSFFASDTLLYGKKKPFFYMYERSLWKGQP